MNEKEENVKKLWDSSSQAYSGSIKAQLENDSRRVWLDLILENAPAGDRLDVLDLGTGPGFFSIILSLAGHRAVGVDASPMMLEQARANARAAGADCEFRQMNIQKLEYGDNSFDLVVCRNVTWTLYEPEEAYREWKRVLRPGGRLLIFDAEWYMNMFDEGVSADLGRRIRAYREKYRELPARFAVNQPTNYMRQLSLLGVRRPVWDRATLWRLRFEDVVCRTDLNSLVDMTDVDSMLYAATPMFLVRGTKVSPDDELRMDLRDFWNGRSAAEGVLSVMETDGRSDYYSGCLKPLLPARCTVLDAGCGGGGIAACLARDGYDVTALDDSAAMLEEAGYTAADAGVSVKTVQADLCGAIPLPDGSFDCVILNDVLWALLDPERALAEASRVLRAGGTMLIGDGLRYQHLTGPDGGEAYVEKWKDVSEASLRPIYGVTCSRATMIDDAWEKLPLSFRDRPGWDKAELERLGFSLCCQVSVQESDRAPEAFILKFRKN